MRKHFFLFVSIIVCLPLLSGNSLSVDAARLQDKPPEPVGSWSSSYMKSSVCKAVVDNSDESNHGSLVCTIGTNRGFVSMGLPNLIVSGPYPNYGLVGVPVIYKYEWEQYNAIPVVKAYDPIRSINGTRERYNGIEAFVLIVANNDKESDSNVYGNLYFDDKSASDYFGILESADVPNGSYWDQRVNYGVEGWRTTGGSMGEFQLINGEIRTKASIESALGVTSSFGTVSDGRRWGDNTPYYDLSYAPDYFFAVNSSASSIDGTGTRRSTGENAFQIGVTQYWDMYARLSWDSIDRWVWWTEEECHMEPGPYAWSLPVEVCEDVEKSGWLVADPNPYDSGWQLINKSDVYDRDLFVDNTSDGHGQLERYLNIDYYQSQPLMTRD